MMNWLKRTVIASLAVGLIGAFSPGLPSLAAYNFPSVFGPFTGDCTTPASNSSVITCTKSSGTSFASMAFQAASSVVVTGGTIDGTIIGATTPTTAAFTSATTTTLATSDSSTKVANAATTAAKIAAALPSATTSQFYYGSGAAGSAQVGSFGAGLNFSGGTLSAASSVLRGYIAGLTLVNDVTTPTTILDISSGNATDSTNAVSITIGAFTKKTGGAWAAGTGSNGMGNGLTIAASAWYDVCLAYNGGVPDIWFDTSNRATSYTECTNKPTSISGSFYRRVGSILTNGSSQIVAFVQNGDEFLWKAPPLDVNSTGNSTTAVLYPLTVPTGFKVNARFRAISTNTATPTTAILLNSPDETAVVPTGGNGSLISGNSVNSYSAGEFNVRTDASARIRATAGAASTTLAINTFGWVDTRGRNN